MDSQRTYQLGQEFAEALRAVERRDEGALERMVERFGPRARLLNAALSHTDEERSGPDGARAFWQAYQDTFREARTEFFELTSSERAAGLFWTTRGVDARGEPLDYDGVTLLVFDDDGKIELFRGYYDTRDLSRTVGQQEG
ncbi:MAG TPA: nuclear transport factor 2 family protein [Chloroflexaceae bacterium]|nr:nuclear transport factor 2 family protein [Chloroflexaceae bacterium]